MKLGININEIATKAGGHALGAVAFTQLNKLKFMQDMAADPKKGILKGLITAGIGYVAVPKLAKSMKMGGKKGNLIEYAGEGLGMLGIMIAANAMMPAKDGKPALFPVISGVDGYEQNPIEGLGVIEEDEFVQGFDDEGNPISGYEQNPIEGLTDASSGDMDAAD